MNAHNAGINSMTKIPKKSTKPWKPKKKMVDLLNAMADPTIKPTITAWCEEIEIDRKTYYNWYEQKEFVEWINKEWQIAMKNLKPYLDNIALKKAAKDFKYWEALQKMYHGYQDNQKVDIDVTTNGKSLNPFDNLSLKERLAIYDKLKKANKDEAK